MNSFRLDWCSHEAAKWAISRWYYRPEMPVGKLVKIGVWIDAKLSGVIVFGCGASDSLGARFGCTPFETCEMVRLAMRPEHGVPLSRGLRVALAMLRKKCPGLKLVITFADPAAGHVGTVYQAANFVYLGTTGKDWRYVKDGEEHHSRNVRASGFVTGPGGVRRPCLRPTDCDSRYQVEGKHRYGYAFDEQTKERLLATRAVAPKKVCGESRDSAAPAHQAGEDGAVPISPLQSEVKQAESTAHRSRSETSRVRENPDQLSG